MGLSYDITGLITLARVGGGYSTLFVCVSQNVRAIPLTDAEMYGYRLFVVKL